LLNLHGIAKPVYRAFEVLHRLGNELFVVEGAHETVEVWVARNRNTVTVLLINQAQPRHSIQTELVQVHLTHAPAPRAAYLERIDEDHANPRRGWVDLGEPDHLGRFEVEQLHAASRLVKEPVPWTFEAGTIGLALDLSPQGVAAISLEFVPGLSQGG
jgi:xylan 1,4-beta-xylosidase